MIPRHYFLLTCLLAALCLTSCSSTKGIPDARATAELLAPPVGVDMPAPDSIPTAIKQKEIKETEKEKPSVLQKAASFLFDKGKTAKETVQNSPYFPSKKCKGCQFTIQNGNGNTSSQAAIDKNKAAAVLASPAATLSNAAENSQQQNVQGDGNELEARQANPTTEAPGPLATLAAKLTGPLGYVLAAVALVVVGYLLWLIWGFLPKRRRDAPTPPNTPGTGMPW